LRRLLFACLVLAVLIALGYTLENWRGRRAWEQCKRDLEAKSEVLDWAAFCPKPAPDAQNMMAVPLVESWFVKDSTNHFQRVPLHALLKRRGLNELICQRYGTNPVLAELVLADSAAPTVASPGAIPVKLEDLATVLASNWPPDLRRWTASAGFDLVSRYPYAGPPRRFQVAAPLEKVQQALSGKRWEWARPITFAQDPASKVVRVLAANPPPHELPAPEFLEWAAQFQPHVQTIRDAAKRPSAWIKTDSSSPLPAQVPNFVSIRTVAQFAGDCALARLLSAQPDAAVQDLALVGDLQRATLSDLSLVSVMIRVALAGLQATTIERGFVENLWREPHWAVLQEQMARTQLLPELVTSLRGGERARILRLFENLTRKQLDFPRDMDSSIGWYIRWCPRGWIFQNMAIAAPLYQALLDPVDLVSQRVDPRRIDQASEAVRAQLTRRHPYQVLTAMCIPNFMRAFARTAESQTRVNQALLACALARCRAQTGKYPETLEALTPQFLAKLPHDLILGQPLRYRLTGPGRYQLWSVGWDGQDNGGTTADWVWPGS
jgi:hypothetical protein